MLTRAMSLRNELGNIIKWYGTSTDIEQLKRAEENARKTHAQLAHVTRLTTLGELAASIAHEVNQPLTAITNNANACLDLVPSGTPELDEVREALSDIVNDAERASDVLARIRALAKKAPLEKAAATIGVQDFGIGLKAEEMDRVFDAFYTTKPQGMGVGLAIIRSIIEEHGGRLWAEPNQGPGATFLFSLPVAGGSLHD